MDGFPIRRLRESPSSLSRGSKEQPRDGKVHLDAKCNQRLISSELWPPYLPPDCQRFGPLRESLLKVPVEEVRSNEEMEEFILTPSATTALSLPLQLINVGYS